MLYNEILKMEVNQMMKMFKSFFLFFLFVLFCSTLIFSGTYQYPIKDAHCHFVDFVQDTDGIDALIKNMDKAEVEEIILFGLPVTKTWEFTEPLRPVYYDDDDSRVYYYSSTDIILARRLLLATEEQRNRIHPFICGFNPTDKNAVDHINRMLEWFPGLWEGIGEILTRHDDLSRLSYGEQARANHPALDAVYELAAKHNFPVWIHSDIGTAGKEEAIYFHEIEEAVASHPETTIVWCHVGYSRYLKIPTIIENAKSLLDNYKNAWVDLSWIVFDEQIVQNGKIDKEWLSFIEKYADRILIGTDKIGHFDTYVSEIRKYDSLLKELSEDSANKISHLNFDKILNK